MRRHKVHAVLDLVEKLLILATASAVFALALSLGDVSGQAQATTTKHTHNVVIRPTFSHLLATTTGSDTHASPANSGATAKIAPASQRDLTCTGRTVMNIVAHQDDDLLFINPNIYHDIERHDCVRTVYVTAGDDGRGRSYLLSREAGSEAAYSVMLGGSMPWAYQKVRLASGADVTVANPVGNQDVTLVFLRLPDGNLDGSGFPDTGYQSIAKLEMGSIPLVSSVDGKTTYTSARLTETLADLMKLYVPTRINTQADDTGFPVSDHSDHLATSRYATQAATLYTEQSHVSAKDLVRYFMGYPIRSRASNLSSNDIAQKSAAFFAYAVHDPGVCTSMEQCVTTDSSYGLYLSRQYTMP